MPTTESIAPAPDAALVAQSLEGQREAFGQIVARYQALVCALAYSATGNVSQSEDLAQKTFIAAWQHLGELREPAKLRSWLCGIARHTINQDRRQLGREPSHAAATLEAAENLPASEPPPAAQAISREESALLWRELGQLPELYREPLVLYYRGEQSVARVAEALELSEDAVMQRLSRGRKMLQERMLAFVETALGRSGPGTAFTLSVQAALPMLAVSGKIGAMGAGMAKGGAMAGGLGWAGLAATVLGPVLGIVGGWVGVSVQLKFARSAEEKKMIKKNAWTIVALVAVVVVLTALWSIFFEDLWAVNPLLTVLGFAGIWAAYVALLVPFALRSNQRLRQLRAEQNVGPTPVEPSKVRFDFWPVKEYRSAWSFLGLPLVHIRAGRRDEEKLRPAVGWIAGGDFAIGGLCAAGGVAIAPLSFGGMTVGLISFGGAAFGLLAVGGAALGIWAGGGVAAGWWAMGGVAVGNFAFGGCALAWEAACGGAAVAKQFALGGAASALHANDEAAKAFIQGRTFFKVAQDGLAGSRWFLVLCWLPMLFVLWPLWQAWKGRRAGAKN